MALEKQLHQQTCMEHAFPAEDELGVLDDPDIPEPPPGQAQEQQSQRHIPLSGLAVISETGSDQIIVYIHSSRA